jgi:NAD(P)-dependent dehydrogenase (short-subunit alcohol dehydrogenase family)
MLKSVHGPRRIDMTTTRKPGTALITGGSQGLGRALAEALADRGWRLVIDARRGDRLADAAESLGRRTEVAAIGGDVRDPEHRAALLDAADRFGGLDLLVNNASTLGASPLPRLADLTDDVARSLVEVNLLAPLALTRDALPRLRAAEAGTVLNITSDAGAEAYEGWGGYGATKAALEHASRVLAEEEPEVRVLIVDPGDMRTEMHQDAFPGEDISDRPPPEDSVPGLLALIDGEQPSGRYHAPSVTPPDAAVPAVADRSNETAEAVR